MSSATSGPSSDSSLVTQGASWVIYDPFFGRQTIPVSLRVPGDWVQPVGPTLGKGSFGKVIVIRNGVGTPFAVKSAVKPWWNEAIKREGAALRAANKAGIPHTVELFGSFSPSEELFAEGPRMACLITSYAGNQDLSKLIRESASKSTSDMISQDGFKRTGPLTARVRDLRENLLEIPGESEKSVPQEIPPMPTADAISLTYQLLETVAGLEELGLCHFDLKPENLMWWEGRLKVVDFGLVEKPQPGSPCSQPFFHAAPEVIRGEDYDTRVDMWSVGSIFFETLTGKRFCTGSQEDPVFESTDAGYVRGDKRSAFRLEHIKNRCDSNHSDFWEKAVRTAGELKGDPQKTTDQVIEWMRKIFQDAPSRIHCRTALQDPLFSGREIRISLDVIDFSPPPLSVEEAARDDEASFDNSASCHFVSLTPEGKENPVFKHPIEVTDKCLHIQAPPGVYLLDYSCKGRPMLNKSPVYLEDRAQIGLRWAKEEDGTSIVKLEQKERRDMPTSPTSTSASSASFPSPRLGSSSSSASTFSGRSQSSFASPFNVPSESYIFSFSSGDKTDSPP